VAYLNVLLLNVLVLNVLVLNVLLLNALLLGIGGKRKHHEEQGDSQYETHLSLHGPASRESEQKTGGKVPVLPNAPRKFEKMGG